MEPPPPGLVTVVSKPGGQRAETKPGWGWQASERREGRHRRMEARGLGRGGEGGRQRWHRPGKCSVPTRAG